MYKKTISFFCALSLMLTLAACSSQSAEESTPTSQASEPATQPTVETVPTATEHVFTEISIVDNDACTFRITGIQEDAMFGYTLKVYLENKTDKDLMFSLSDTSVNGFMCDPVFAATVAAGMKANESITFLKADFTANQIVDVTDITFTLRIYDSNDWLADPVVEDTFTVYPQGEDAVVPYIRESNDSDIVLFDNENCTMIVTGFDPDNLFGFKMNVYLENKTDKTLMFSAGDVSVNGFMCDPYWAVTVVPGKRSNTDITWTESSFTDNGITEVETIHLPIRVYDSNDIMSSDILSETFTVNP